MSEPFAHTLLQLRFRAPELKPSFIDIGFNDQTAREKSNISFSFSGQVGLKLIDYIFVAAKFNCIVRSASA